MNSIYGKRNEYVKDLPWTGRSKDGRCSDGIQWASRRPSFNSPGSLLCRSKLCAKPEALRVGTRTVAGRPRIEGFSRYFARTDAREIFSSSAATAARRLSGITFA